MDWRDFDEVRTIVTEHCHAVPEATERLESVLATLYRAMALL